MYSLMYGLNAINEKKLCFTCLNIEILQEAHSFCN